MTAQPVTLKTPPEVFTLGVHFTDAQLLAEKASGTYTSHVEVLGVQLMAGQPAIVEETYDDPADDHRCAFWSVYLHLTEGGLDCVGDFTTRQDAENYAKHLEDVLA